MVGAASAAAVSGATIAIEVAATSAAEVTASSEATSASATTSAAINQLFFKKVLLVGSASGASALAALSGEVAGLLAVVADLRAAGVAVSSGRAAAVSVVASVGAAVGPAVLGGVVLLRLLAELDGDARAADVAVVQLLDGLVGVLLVLVVDEGVISLR